VYAALEKHVIDGTAWPAAGSLPFKWYEVSKYYLRPTFGTTTHLMLMNLKRFDRLDSALQHALLAQGERLERDVLERFDELATIESSEFERHRLIRTRLCDEPLQQLARSWADGVWNLALNKNHDAAERLRALARIAGLAQ
jgi:TRAP-type transport system periplasmic protein